MALSRKKQLRKPKSEIDPSFDFSCISVSDFQRTLRMYERGALAGIIELEPSAAVEGAIHVCLDRVSGFFCQLCLLGKGVLPVRISITPEKFMLRISVTPACGQLSLENAAKIIRAAHHTGFRLTHDGDSLIMRTELFQSKIMKIYAQSSASLIFALSMDKMLEQYGISK